ncbi:hypothetical protein VPH35_026428 [Triticum aestivum]
MATPTRCSSLAAASPTTASAPPSSSPATSSPPPPPPNAPSPWPPSPTASTPAASPRAPTPEYLRRMEAAGSDTLASLLLADGEEPVRVLVYDSHLPWARRVARDAGVAAAAFFTQMCAVDVVYGEVSQGRVALPLADGSVLRGRLSVELGPNDVPPFVTAPAWYPAFTESALSQFDGLD